MPHNLEHFSYRELQALAKEQGIRANQKKSALVRALSKAPEGAARVNPGNLPVLWGAPQPQTPGTIVRTGNLGNRGFTLPPGFQGYGEPIPGQGRVGVTTERPTRPVRALPPGVAGMRPDMSGRAGPQIPKIPGGKELSRWAKFMKFGGPALNVLFLGMLVNDMIKGMGGWGSKGAKDRAAASLMEGMMLPGMQQRHAGLSDLAEFQLDTAQMEGLGRYARGKQRGMREFGGSLDAELDSILARKAGRVARASYMSPDIQRHVAHLVSTGNL
jgi:hypothetical protein